MMMIFKNHIEFAFFFREMGVQVTVLEVSNKLLAKEDDEVIQEFTRVFSSKVKTHTGIEIVGASLCWQLVFNR